MKHPLAMPPSTAAQILALAIGLPAATAADLHLTARAVADGSLDAARADALGHLGVVLRGDSLVFYEDPAPLTTIALWQRVVDLLTADIARAEREAA